jgi:hypothetical protein
LVTKGRARAWTRPGATQVDDCGQAPAVVATKAVTIKAEANSSKPLICQETIVCPHVQTFGSSAEPDRRHLGSHRAAGAGSKHA